MFSYFKLIFKPPQTNIIHFLLVSSLFIFCILKVAASALGTVIGNVGTNLAGNFLNGCSNRGRRSVFMHKIEKRQAVEASAKSGNPEADPVSQNYIV